jgi:hypothetical protein
MSSRRKRRRKESDFAALQDRIERCAEREITKQLRRFPSGSDEEKKHFEAFIDRVTDRRKNLHIKPEFTPQVVGVSQQILAFGMAGLGLVVAFGTRLGDVAPFWQSVIKAAFLIALDLTAISFIVLVWFFVQARSRYPFLFLKRMGNAPPFFYYETLNRSWHFRPLSGSTGIFRSNRNYLGDFSKFAKTLVDEDQDPIQRARYELQQYYLLIVYQGFLDQYEMQLEHIFLYCSVSGVLSALVVCWWLL